MLSLSFTDAQDVKFEISFNEISEHIIEIKGDIPHKECGFYLSRIDHEDRWDYTQYKTIYRVLENGIVQFSNDGSVYVPPTQKIIVSVEWLDDNNAKNSRPASVSVTVFADGKRKNILTLKKQNNWKKIYDNVLMDSIYSVEAQDVLRYEKQITNTTIYYRLLEEEND